MTRNQPITNKVTYWQPSTGDTITGIIQGSGVWKNLLHDEQKNLFLQENSGTIVVVTLNRYLLHSLTQSNAAPGDSVTVTFHSREQKSNGRSFNRYTLLVNKADIS